MANRSTSRCRQAFRLYLGKETDGTESEHTDKGYPYGTHWNLRTSFQVKGLTTGIATFYSDVAQTGRAILLQINERPA